MPISRIQGVGMQAQQGTYNIEGIVTGVFPFTSPRGFYVQEEDTDADTSTFTSEAVSYTHLDVYKRQLQVRAVMRHPILEFLTHMSKPRNLIKN